MAVTKEKELNIQSISEGKLTWFYIEKPSAAEVEFLKQHFKFHPLNLHGELFATIFLR